ncbi:hypothetical protein F6R98_13730 [Candidatus Methylospira mobilis]|uniref:Lipoprotein n=1 Tax=Candidatus Methylospira mobilis TaxID=1808979 RepID=A0A5Q0BN65_9GAMM|nr:hypothetical protein [Candidatus Methylospira mobilis]QFY43547.1 hypothetical protein F6R98_13730 [Candidatus Methylospira mobilis]
MQTQFRFYTAASILLLYTVLSGCSSNKTSLVIKSEPDGAYISQTETGAGLGVAPVTLDFDKAELVNKTNRDKERTGCFRVKGYSARWMSGATASSAPAIRLCNPVGKNFTVTLQRNANAPGLEKDLEFAKQDKDSQTQQQQANAPQKQQAKVVQPVDEATPAER